MQKLITSFLQTIGVLLILVGLLGAYYGPLEIYVFYLFSKGGRFYYDGFGVGSLWFAYLVIQNLGYYVVAALCIPIGIGHLKLRRWTLTLTQLILCFWLGAGILLAANLVALVPQVFDLELSQDVLITRLAIICVLAFFALILLPALALWFYKSAKVKSLFYAHDPSRHWIDNYPLSLAALLLLFGMMILVMHIAIFFQSLFPFFGQFLLGRPPVYLISLCILTLGMLIYGIVRLKRWAWWGSLVYLLLLSISSLLSFSRYSFYEIILMMDLPTTELEFVNQLTLFHDFHLTLLVVTPLLVALGLLIHSKQHFGKTYS